MALTRVSCIFVFLKLDGSRISLCQDLQNQVTAGDEELGQFKRQAEEIESNLRQTVEQLNEVIFHPMVLEQFFISVQTNPKTFLRFVIGLEIWQHSLNQSDAKLKQIATRSLAFSRLSVSFAVCVFLRLTQCACTPSSYLDGLWFGFTTLILLQILLLDDITSL